MPLACAPGEINPDLLLHQIKFATAGFRVGGPIAASAANAAINLMQKQNEGQEKIDIRSKEAYKVLHAVAHSHSVIYIPLSKPSYILARTIVVHSTRTRSKDH